MSEYRSCKKCRKLIYYNPMANAYSVLPSEINIDGDRYCVACGNQIVKERGVAEMPQIKPLSGDRG